MSIPTIAIEPCRLCDGNKCTDACDHKELIRQAADLHQFLDDKGAPRNCEDGWGPTPWSLRGRVEILLFRPSDTSQGVSEAVAKIMEQAQVFASAWSLVGGQFDNGTMIDAAEEEKRALEKMIRAALRSEPGEAT